MPPKAPATNGGKGNTIVTVAALFFFVLVTWLTTNTIGSREQRTHMRHQGDGYAMAHRQRLNTLGELENFEDWESDLTRSVTEMCWDMEAKNESVRWANTAATLRHINNDPVTQDNIIGKISVFRGKGSTKGSGIGPKLWCMTLGMAERLGEAEWTQRLWAKKCDTNYLYIDATSVPDVRADTIVTIKPRGGNIENNGWQRLRSVLQHPLQHSDFDEYDFFLFTQDATFVFVENLRKMLLEPHVQWFAKMQVPVIIGHRMTSGTGINFASGGGFVANKAAMRILNYVLTAENCNAKTEGAALDLSLAECLKEYGVFFSDSVDEFGEDRMHAFNPDILASTAKNPDRTPWYKNYHTKSLPRGLDTASQFSILFSMITPHVAHHIYHKVYL